MKRSLLLFCFLLLALGSHCQESIITKDIPDHILEGLGNVLELNFVPVHALLLILGGIFIKKYNFDLLLQSAFGKGWKRTLLKIDFLVFYLNIILCISFIRFESYFMISEVGGTLDSRLIALTVTFAISVLSYQYVLNHVFVFLDRKGININSRTR